MTEFNKDPAFLNAKPEWNHDWHLAENNRVIIMVPKFGNHRLGRWMMSKMARPKWHMKLDEIGSFVWHQCDGRHDIRSIGESMARKFGNKVEPVYERLNLFFTSLHQSKSIRWIP